MLRRWGPRQYGEGKQAYQTVRAGLFSCFHSNLGTPQLALSTAVLDKVTKAAFSEKRLLRINNSAAARQAIQQWQPSSASLLLISVSSQTSHPAMTAQLHLPALDLCHQPDKPSSNDSPAPPPCSGSLSPARQAIQQWQPSSTSLLWISVTSQTSHPAMTAQLHLPALDLCHQPDKPSSNDSPAPPPCSGSLSPARQAIQQWQPSSTSLLWIAPALCQQQDNPSSYESPAPPSCSWPLLVSVSSKTIHASSYESPSPPLWSWLSVSSQTTHPAMTAQLHLPPLDLSWPLSAARQFIQQWQPSSTSLLLTSPGLCQQPDNSSSNDSPAPPPCCWPLLASVSSQTIHPAMTAQLHLPVADLSWPLSAARQFIQQWQPSSTSLLLTSPGLCQQPDNSSSNDSPAPPPCCWPLLASVSSQTIHPAMTAQLHLPVADLCWSLSAARQFIQQWQPSSTSLLLTSAGLCQQPDNSSSNDSPAPRPCCWPLLVSVSSQTIHPAMTAQLHVPVADLCWSLSAARQFIQQWQPSSTSLLLTSAGLCQQPDNSSSNDSPAPRPCCWPLLVSVSSQTIHPAMTAQLHLPVADLCWSLSAARQFIQQWQPSSTSLLLTSAGLCQQPDNSSSNDSPAPPPCCWPLLVSVSSQTIRPAMTAQHHVPVADLCWSLSAARQFIQQWQPSSTSLLLTSAGLCQQPDNSSSNDSPAPPPCCWPLLVSVSSQTIRPAMTAQHHVPVADLCWSLSAARQFIQQWQPSSTSLLLTSAGLCQQPDNSSSNDSPAPPPCCWPLLVSVSSQTIHPAMTAQHHLPALDLCQQPDNSSSNDSPAPPPCCWPLLVSVSSKTIHPAMTAQLHLPALDLCQQPDNSSSNDSPAPPPCSWSLSAARQFIQQWQPSSTSLLLISVSSQTIHPAMTAQLHLPVADLSWSLSAARQFIQQWQPSTTSLLLTSPGLCQQPDNSSSNDSPAPPPCCWPLLVSVSSQTIHPAMTAQLHLPVADLSWSLSAARQFIQQWQPSSTSLLLISVSSQTIHPAMTAQLHLPALDLCQQPDNSSSNDSPAPPPCSWSLSAARQFIQQWQPSSTSLLLISVSSQTIRPAMTAQLHLPALDLCQQPDNSSSNDSPAPPPCSWSLSAARQFIQQWQPSSTSLLLISVSSQTIRPAMTAQLHLPALDLCQQPDNSSSNDSPAPPPCSWSLSAARQFIQQWQPSSTSLLLISVSSQTIRPAMTAQLHLPALDLCQQPDN